MKHTPITLKPKSTPIILHLQIAAADFFQKKTDHFQDTFSSFMRASSSPFL